MEGLVDTGIFSGTGSAGWRAVLLLLNAIPDPAWIKDAQGRYLAVNPAYLADYRDRTRRPATDLVGRSASELHNPDDAAIIEAEDAQLLRSGGFVRSERTAVDDTGRRRHFEINRFVLLDDDGNAVGTMGIARDISERVELTESLRESERKLSTLVRNLPGTVLRLRDDLARSLEFASAGVEQLCGYPPAEFVAGGRGWLSVMHPEERDRVWDDGRRQLAAFGGYTIQYRVISRDGRIRHVWERGVRTDVEGLIEAYAADVTEAHERMQRLAYLAGHDELTGLSNRRGLLERVRQSMAASADPLTVVVVNLDHFKVVNDSLGHEDGDRVLCEIGNRLRDRLRPGEEAARIGADAFAVLLVGPVGQALDARVGGLLQALRRPLLLAGREVGVTGSAGYAIHPDHADEAEALLRRAEVAMTQARDSGRDRHVRYAPGSDARGERRMQTIADLRRAIERNQLSLQFQPLVRAGGVEVAGIEALLRWAHPQRGNIPPAEFIPLAEESGLIFEIGEWVLERACRELVALHAEGFALEHIAVNLSVAQLRDERFVTRVAEVLRRSGLDPAALALEVTESCAVFDADNVMRRLNALKAMGVRLVMDDFGTGYSSLAQLRRFPIDRLKLDRLFVHEMDLDPVAVRICEVVTTLAHALGLAVIAEGVETQAQRDQLERIGCDLLQGFLLAQPLSGQALREFLRTGAATGAGADADAGAARA